MFGPACGIGICTLHGVCRRATVRRVEHLAVAADRDLRPASAGAPWSSTRKAMVCGWPTMPKRGAVTSTTRRSRSLRRAGDQRMHRRGEAERRGLGRHVVDAAVGEHDRAGDAVGRHVGERGAERREQPRAVGLAVGLAGFDDAHLEARDAAEPLGQQRRARPRSACARSPKFWLGLLSTTTATTEDSGSRSSRVSDGLASASTISASASARTSAPRLRATSSSAASTTASADRRPQHVGRNQRREGDAETQMRSYCPSRSSSAGMCTWSAL